VSALVLVVGVGRSGTSLLAGILAQLGFHIPQPEVRANDTNPRGFGEPRWVVDFHADMLRALRVTVNDSRPQAWDITFKATENDETLSALRGWLAGELRSGDAVVVKDPRTVWFLPLWIKAASELGVEPAFITTLRSPPEVLRSAVKSYGTWQSEASRAAAWLNMALETELVTRGYRRAVVRYDDLLADWRRELGRVGGRLELPLIADISPERAAAVDGFVDADLHRNRVTWQELSVPPRVVDLADRAWTGLLRLTEPDQDTPATHVNLDALRDEYVAMYAEAEAIVQSTVIAAKPRKKRKVQPRPTLRVRIMRRIPATYRRRARRVMGRRSRG
jgi:hypothetical protein